MSWFARSIANTLKLDDDEDEVIKIDPKAETPNDDASSPTSPSRGVKEDLSELTKTLTNQFWGVASFLAPAPQAEPRSESETSRPEPDSILGIRGDFAEIGGKFRSGISRLSNNINVSEITKMASNFLQLESDDEDAEMRKEGFDLVSTGAVGVTEEVVAFVRDIAMHPETWLDFPLPDDTGDHVDFDLSDVQQEHALAVERLAPRLAALRIELCPGYMSESCFWKIYFVLVHPRLDKQDAELLSTPQIVEARALLAHELKKRTTTKPEDLSEKKSIDSEEIVVSHHEEPLCVPSSPVVSENKQDKTSDLKITTSTAQSTSEIVKHSVDSKKSHNSVTEEDDVGQVKNQSPKCDVEKDDDDDWLKEETSEIGGKTIPVENEDDVSFSDLEDDDDDGDVPTSYRKSNNSSSDWVQLGKNAKHSSDNENAANKESNDWLDVDDIVVT